MNNRLYAILLLICTLTSLSCRAQTEKFIQYGLVTGLNLSDFYTANTVTNLNAGFNVGTFVRLPVSNVLALEPELYFSTKGSSVIYNTQLVVNTANLNLTYIELPIVFLLNINRLINFQIGPYASYLIAVKVKNISSINLFNLEQSPDIDNFNRLDAGVLVGVGLDVKSVSIGMRYNLGLMKVGKSQQVQGLNYNLADAGNGVLNFYLAIGFNRKNRNIHVSESINQEKTN